MEEDAEEVTQKELGTDVSWKVPWHSRMSFATRRLLGN